MWEVHFDDISLIRIIGEGAFGKVYSGDLLKQFMKDKKQQQMKKGVAVAVKMLQSTICLCQRFFIENPPPFIFLTFTNLHSL